MTFPSSVSRSAWLVFLLGVSISLLWAVGTDNRWEDWYITYRASKNLAHGHGLVFQPGERVHSFTSPLGTLLPAGLAWATGGERDEAVLWLFRVASAAALGAAGAILHGTLRQLGLGPAGAAAAIALYYLDTKTIAFTVNGMETGWMALFLALQLAGARAFAEDRRRWHTLAAAWTGLMWTRPDAFVYIGLFTGGWLLYERAAWRDGRSWAAGLGRAAAGAGLLYLPWVLWAGWYYGNPIPHTILAKTAYVDHAVDSLGTRLATYLAHFLFNGETALQSVYLFNDGWPGVTLAVTGLLTLLGLAALALPGVPPIGRACALAALGGLFYVKIITRPAPWYFPNATFFLWPALAFSLQSLAGRVESSPRLSDPGRRRLRQLGAVLVVGVILSQAVFLAGAARQFYHQQRVVEWGNRQQVGLWLRQNAQPADRVFVECLGYIGFYSGLKFYDYPGLSSREMVETVRRLQTNNFGRLIDALRPEWVVLRGWEMKSALEGFGPGFPEAYALAATFDVRERIQDLPRFWGRDFLRVDELFLVFRRTTSPPPPRRD